MLQRPTIRGRRAVPRALGQSSASPEGASAGAWQPPANRRRTPAVLRQQASPPRAAEGRGGGVRRARANPCRRLPPCALPLAQSQVAGRDRTVGPSCREARRRAVVVSALSAPPGVIGLGGAAPRAPRASWCLARPWRARWCGRRRTMSVARTSGTTS